LHRTSCWHHQAQLATILRHHQEKREIGLFFSDFVASSVVIFDIVLFFILFSGGVENLAWFVP